MGKFIFVSTQMIGGTVKVKALSNQFFEDDDPIRTDLNIMADRNVRGEYELKTIFAVDSLTDEGNYYKAVPKTLIPVADKDYKVFPNCPVEILTQFKEFMELNGNGGLSVEAQKVEMESDGVTPKKREPKFIETLRHTENFKPPTIADDGFYVDEDVWYVLVRNIVRRKNTMLTGPTGTGKTELVSLVSKKLEKEMKMHDMGTMQDPQASLLGVHRLRNGQSVFDYSAFSEDIKEGNIILLDELSRAPISANNILFSCLDSRRCLPVEIADSLHTRNIPVHKECAFVATANLGGEYTGTHMIDRALLDRFQILELNYMSKVYETEVLVKRTKVDGQAASVISGLANDLRDAQAKGELSTGVSHRHTLEIAELVKDGLSMVKAFQMILLPLFEGSSAEGERNIVLGMIKKY